MALLPTIEKENEKAVAAVAFVLGHLVSSAFARVEVEFQHGRFYRVHTHQTYSQLELDAMKILDPGVFQK